MLSQFSRVNDIHMYATVSIICIKCNVHVSQLFFFSFRVRLHKDKDIAYTKGVFPFSAGADVTLVKQITLLVCQSMCMPKHLYPQIL